MTRPVPTKGRLVDPCHEWFCVIDRAYSSVRYTSTVKQKKFNENGTISSGEAYIYNQSAIDFLVKKAKEIVNIQASRTECK